MLRTVPGPQIRLIGGSIRRREDAVFGRIRVAVQHGKVWRGAPCGGRGWEGAVREVRRGDGKVRKGDRKVRRGDGKVRREMGRCREGMGEGGEAMEWGRAVQDISGCTTLHDANNVCFCCFC